MLPTFILIGAPKAGSTSLHHYLAQHPEIHMSNPKEPNYFIKEKNFDRGRTWYEALFDAPAEAFGESSVGYASSHRYEGVPERMHRLLPDVKLIYLLRDPIDLIISGYMNNLARGRETGTLEEVLTNPVGHNYVNACRYHMQLQAFLNYYPMERIHILTNHELKYERRDTLASVFRFVGVDDTFYSPAYEQVHNRSADMTRPTKLDRWIGALHLREAGHRAMPSFARDLYRKVARRPIERPTMSDTLRARITEALAEDVEDLRRLTGKKFENWSL